MDSDREQLLDDDSESSDDEEDEDLTVDEILQRVRQNDPETDIIYWCGIYERIQNMTDEEWEELGRDISNNTHLEELALHDGALSDHKMSFLFRGLTTSSTFKDMELYRNELSVEGVRSMVPFFQNANNLRHLFFDDNNIQSVGFNVLFRALRDSPIEHLQCHNNGIESIEIDSDHIPRNLKFISLEGNRINADGCRGLATLLQGGNTTLKSLWLCNNKIDDEGVAILVDALKNNTSLIRLVLRGNDDISSEGKIMLLKLVNDISSIKATLQSNHTLQCLDLNDIDKDELLDADDKIQMHIFAATVINMNYVSNPEAAGRQKVIASHLQSQNRAALCRLQEVDHSVYNEIDPLHLPEVFSLIGRRHGQGELYDALKTSIMGLLSTVNMKKCIQQQRDYYAAIVAELDAKLAAMEESEADVTQNAETQNNKRRRV
jgi:hypothetical protein